MMRCSLVERNSMLLSSLADMDFTPCACRKAWRGLRVGMQAGGEYVREEECAVFVQSVRDLDSLYSDFVLSVSPIARI